MASADTLARYNLKDRCIQKIDLRSCYMQQRPNQPFNDMIMRDNGFIDLSMLNSPHLEIINLYIKHGEKWVKDNYHNTRYHKMLKLMGKDGFPHKIFKLFKSLKKGYLRKKYAKEYIVVLEKPFAKSRYNRDVKNLVPEIWSGHHRAAILIALCQYEVKVLIADDAAEGLCASAGKIHNLCVKE